VLISSFVLSHDCGVEVAVWVVAPCTHLWIWPVVDSFFDFMPLGLLAKEDILSGERRSPEMTTILRQMPPTSMNFPFGLNVPDPQSAPRKPMTDGLQCCP